MATPLNRPTSTPVPIRGVVYASQKEAARAHGVAPSTIWYAIQNGTLDQVGLRGMGGPRTGPYPLQPRGWARAQARDAIMRGTPEERKLVAGMLGLIPGVPKDMAAVGVVG